jgi:hypothetical protein
VIDGWDVIEPNLLKVLAITPDDIVRLAQLIDADD